MTAPLRRILVALDASGPSLDALRAAATLAARLGAELEGLFVEDENVLRAAGLPVSRHLSVLGGARRPPAPGDVEAQLRAMAARAREALEQACAPQRLTFSFRVARGQVTLELLAAAARADLLVLGGWGHRVPAGRPGETARSAAARAPISVLILARAGPMSRSLLVAYDGSAGARRALALAARLEQADAGRIELLLAAPDAHAAARLADEARLGLERATALPSRWIGGTRLADLARAIWDRQAVLVVGSDSSVLGGPDGLDRLLDEVPCPVLLAR